jgi:hypothetical protein
MAIEDWYLKQVDKLQRSIDERRDKRTKLLDVLADIGIEMSEDGKFSRTAEGTPLNKEEIERLRVFVDMTLKEEQFLSDRMLGKATIKVDKNAIDGIILDDPPQPTNGE